MKIKDIHYMSFSFFLMAIFLLMNKIIRSVRWWVLLKIQGISLKPTKVLQLSWIGYFAGHFLPGAELGGDAVKGIYLFMQNPKIKTRTLSTMMLDRLMGIYSLIIFALVALIIFGILGNISIVMHTSGIIIFVLFLFLSISFMMHNNQKIRETLYKILPQHFKKNWEGSLTIYKNYKKEMIICFLFSFAANICGIMAFLACGRLFLVNNISIIKTFAVIPLALLSNIIPISPGGLGVGESVSSLLFEQIGIITGAEMMLTVRAVSMCLDLSGGLMYILPVNVKHRN